MFLKSLAVDKGLKYASVRNIELSLSMVLDIAVRDDVLRNNPCKGALRDLQREYGDDAKDVRALTLQEQKIFESCLYCYAVDRNACRRSAWTKVGRYRLRE